MDKFWHDDYMTSLFEPHYDNQANNKKVETFGKILEITIIAVMKHHIYTFSGETRLQSEGSPIWLELTGALARVPIYDILGQTF